MIERNPQLPSQGEVQDEQSVLEDIAWFEARIRQLGDEGVEEVRGSAALQVCRLLLRQRRQLLAALRDGNPEKWPEYAAHAEND